MENAKQTAETHKMKPWWFVLFVLASYGSAQGTLCPALRSQSGEKSLLYGYPVEMLLPSVLVDHPDAKFQNCTERNLVWPNDVPELCSMDSSMCAVTKQNVQTAMGVADWPQYSEALYRLQQAISENRPHEMNIIVLGGSMTHGSVTFSACICQQKVDSTCPEMLEKSAEKDCSWVTMLSRWLNTDIAHSRSNIKITVHNLARTGAASHFMADIIADQLRLVAQVTTLTANDIVFVDHSVNDVSVYVEELQIGFESLIRRLLHLTEGGQRPTIIVLEQNPTGTKQENVTRDLQGVGDYAVTYREVSKHYGVLLWSLREVSWTYLDYTTVGAVNSTIPVHNQVVINGVQHVRMYPKPPVIDYHPPWWRHLFIADVLADSMLRVMSMVGTSTPGLYLRAATTQVPYVVPAPLRDLSSLSQGLCNNTVPYLVDVHASASAYRPSDLSFFENDKSVLPKVGWREYIDHHDSPGFIINSLTDLKQKHLTFPLLKTNDFRDQVIKLVYLKSYTGMGAVRVKICGDYLHTPDHIDALYHDHETYKVSLPTVWTYTLGQSEHSRCANMSVPDRTLQIEYVRFKDQFAPVRRQNHRKFKLMSAQVCTPAQYK